MSETTAPASAHRVPHKPANARRRMRAVLAAEWIKLRSLRSMLATSLLTALVCIGLAASVCANYASRWPHLNAADRAAFNPFDTNMQFVVIAGVFLGFIGVLVATNEYGTGLIRATLAATPQRVLVLAAKAVLAGLITCTVSAAVCFTAFFAGQSILSGHTPHVSLGDPGVPGHLLGSVFYLTALGLIGLFIGSLTRSAATAISGVFALMLVVPILADKLPADAVTRHTVPYLPFNLGWSLWHSSSSGYVSGHVGAHAALLALAAWILILGTLAAVNLRRRDA
jgi:ABC-2 type transport system permease protein